MYVCMLSDHAEPLDIKKEEEDMPINVDDEPWPMEFGRPPDPESPE